MGGGVIGCSIAYHLSKFDWTDVVLLERKQLTCREALLEQKEGGTTRRLVQFRLADPEPLLYHNEPIWRENTIVGHITSGAYGHTLGSCIGLGYVAGAIGGEKFEIEVADKKYTAEVSVRPLYDPDNARIRC